MSKTDFQDGGCGGHLGFSIAPFFGRSPVSEDLCKDKAPGLIWFWRRRFLKVFAIYGHGSILVNGQ